MLLGLFLQASLVFSGEICKQLSVSTNIKKTKDDIISKGIPNKQWSRRSKNPIIVPAIQQLDYVYITIENQNLTIDNFLIDFDDHYFADSQIRLDSRQNGKMTEYAIEIKYECKQYGGAMINYELEFNIPNCGDSQIYWKKLCGNPITTRDGFTIDMIFKNHKQQIISNGIVNNATYFDHDLDNYVFNIPRDVDQLKFLVYMINSNPNTEPIAEGFISDEQTLRSLPEVNISLPFVDTDENVARSWFDGPLAAGGLVDSKEQELNLNFKCLKFGTSKIEMTIPFDYFKDISLVLVKDCTYGNKVQNVLKEQYDDGDSKTLIIYFLFLIIIAGLIINLCFGRKKGLANIPFFHSLISLLLCITCTNNTYQIIFNKVLLVDLSKISQDQIKILSIHPMNLMKHSPIVRNYFMDQFDKINQMKQSNIFILNHLTTKQSQKTYGIANQILQVSSKQLFFGNIVQIIPDNPIPNRFCDINDLFKSQICFFTNIYGLEKTQILEQILENQYFIIIRYLDKQIVFPFNKGKLQLVPQMNNQNKKNKKPEKIENPLEHFINLLKQVRKEYKEQMDLLGKINSFKHPAFINYEFVFPNYTPKNIETPFVTNRVDPNIFEFASYHYFENDPSQILELHITQLLVSLQQSKSSQVLYYNEQSILPVCGDEEDITFFKTDLKPFNRLLNYKEKFYKIVNELDGKLLNVHQYLSPKRIENGQQYLVRGDYVYHHYMQDGFNDKGWGCAYRSFMSVLSWIIENGYSKRLNIPNHQQIQRLLVEMGDKQIEFVNSSEWIGAFEVNMLINKLTNIECKILNIQKGSDILGKLNEFKQYFIQQGAPIMFGGGLYAYTLLGIDYNEQDCRFLILDPHYVGNDNIKSIIEKGGVQWRKADMFSDENFYNFCMPLVE